MQNPSPEIPQIAFPAISIGSVGSTPVAKETVPAPAPESYVDREPIITTATIVGVLSTLVTWAVARGLLGQADEALLVAVIPTVASVLFAYFARRSATSVGRATLAIDEAYAAVPGEDPKPRL